MRKTCKIIYEGKVALTVKALFCISEHQVPTAHFYTFFKKGAWVVMTRLPKNCQKMPKINAI